MVVGQPAQELLRLVALAVRDRQLAGGQFRSHLHHLLAHLRPVAHRQAHVVQHRRHRVLDVLERIARLAVDLHVDQRFGLALAHRLQLAAAAAADRHHRVAEHVHADAQVGQCHGHRIDQERHVVIDHLQHGVAGLPAVALHRGVEQPHVGRARLAPAREVEEIVGKRSPRIRGVQGQLVFGQAVVEGLGEQACILLPVLAGQGTDGAQDRREQRAAPGLLARCCLASLARGLLRGLGGLGGTGGFAGDVLA